MVCILNVCKFFMTIFISLPEKKPVIKNKYPFVWLAVEPTRLPGNAQLLVFPS